MLYAALVGIGFAIVAATAAVTALQYRNLADRVPMHFGFDGRPTSYWPRPLIWLIVVVQIVCAPFFANAAIEAGQGRGPGSLGTAVFSVCILAAMAQVQFSIIATAKTAEQRLPVARFLLSLAVLIALGLLSQRFL